MAVFSHKMFLFGGMVLFVEMSRKQMAQGHEREANGATIASL
jgi:hypothetical protein